MPFITYEQIAEEERKFLEDLAIDLPIFTNWDPNPYTPGILIEKSHIVKLRIAKDQNLIAVPASIGHLTHLRELYIQNNGFYDLPDTIGDLTQLTLLNLYNNKFEVIPETIGRLIHLKSLNLGNNYLRSLPSSIGLLINLNHLYLYNNLLTQLPSSLGNLTHLTGLGLSGNKFSTLPDTFQNLSQLTGLNLSKNRFTALPDWFSSFVNLEGLYLDDNPFTTLPPCLQLLPHLKILTLSNTSIHFFPKWFPLMTSLESVHLMYVPLFSLRNLPQRFYFHHETDIEWDFLPSSALQVARSLGEDELYRIYTIPLDSLIRGYIRNSESLNSLKYERIVYEITHNLLCYLEQKLPEDSPLLHDIYLRNKISLDTDMDILM